MMYHLTSHEIIFLQDTLEECMASCDDVEEACQECLDMLQFANPVGYTLDDLPEDCDED